MPGLSVGTASCVARMYSSELTPRRLRGGVTTFNGLLVPVGIFSTFVVGAVLTALVGADRRQQMCAVAASDLALAIGMPFQPQGARWLIDHGREDEAREFQPDLEPVGHRARDEIAKIVGFWIRLGASGFRIDAVP